MFAWKRRTERVGADVALLLEQGGDPYGEARLRERAAANDDEARHWSRVAVGIAKRTGRRVGLDVATRMAERGDAE